MAIAGPKTFCFSALEFIGVAMSPGHTQFTRMLSFAYYIKLSAILIAAILVQLTSIASLLVIEITAAFAALYAAACSLV